MRPAAVVPPFLPFFVDDAEPVVLPAVALLVVVEVVVAVVAALFRLLESVPEVGLLSCSLGFICIIFRVRVGGGGRLTSAADLLVPALWREGLVVLVVGLFWLAGTSGEMGD